MTRPCTGETLSIRRSPEHDGPTVDEALGGDDLANDLARHEHVGRDDHCRETAGTSPRAELVCGMTDGGGGDVDAVLAEDRADAADHARQVGVAKDRHEALELDRQAPTLYLHEVRHATGPDACARDRHPLAAGDHGHPDQLVEVLGL